MWPWLLQATVLLLLQAWRTDQHQHFWVPHLQLLGVRLQLTQPPRQHLLAWLSSRSIWQCAPQPLGLIPCVAAAWLLHYCHPSQRPCWVLLLLAGQGQTAQQP